MKLAGLLVILLAMSIGGLRNFVPVLRAILLSLAGVAIAGGAIAALLYFLLRRRRATIVETSVPTAEPVGWSSPPVPATVGPLRLPPVNRAQQSVPWTAASIRAALDEIDWYQFEKFCAALLRADGFSVERKGGAQPDGGVDLLVIKDGARALIQCKHWRTWQVQERVVREMLGSMTHFQVKQGAIYTLQGWTEPSARFAAQHSITLVNGDELAASAATQLTQPELEALLRPREHHCPKCEAVMVERSGAFGSFWGCSRYPACRGKLKYPGAR